MVRVRGRVCDREWARQLDKPLPETIAWHGPFENEAKADEVARARMWSRIDTYAHKARPVDLTVTEQAA